jgi:hypothetical protein
MPFSVPVETFVWKEAYARALAPFQDPVFLPVYPYLRSPQHVKYRSHEALRKELEEGLDFAVRDPLPIIFSSNFKRQASWWAENGASSTSNIVSFLFKSLTILITFLDEVKFPHHWAGKFPAVKPVRFLPVIHNIFINIIFEGSRFSSQRLPAGRNDSSCP